MMNETDVVIVGSGMGGAAIYRSLQGSGQRIVVLEAGPAISAGNTHLRNVLPHGGGWRSMLSAILGTSGPRGLGASEDLTTEGPRARGPEGSLPGLGNCRGVGGNALVWGGIVLRDTDASDDEFELAAAWLGARIVSGSPRQEWLREAHGLAPVPLAWSPEQGWHGPMQLAGSGYSPLPSQVVKRIVHKSGRAIGVEVDDRVIRAKHIVVCAGVIGTVQLLWASGLERELPGLGRGIAHHPVAVAQVAIPEEAWSQIAEQPNLDRPAAVREFPAAGGSHTLIVAEMPWMADGRVDGRATLTIYAYATLDDDPNRRVWFDPLPRFEVPRTDAERECEERALRNAKAWAERLGPVLPSGRARVLPRGADQHLAGGARIGDDGDSLAVADRDARLRCLENVWIAGAAALRPPVTTHPTQRIVALAARTGALLRG